MREPYNLLPEEKIIDKTRTHIKVLSLPIFYMVIMFIIFGIIIGLLSRANYSTQTKTYLILTLLIIVIVLLAIVTVKPWIVWLNSIFVITDHRLIWHSGTFKKIMTEISLIKINTIKVEQNISERFFHAGTIIIESNSDRMKFRDIPKVKKLQNELQLLVYSDQ